MTLGASLQLVYIRRPGLETLRSPVITWDLLGPYFSAIRTVSYTHLDVYKRQMSPAWMTREWEGMPWITSLLIEMHALAGNPP